MLNSDNFFLKNQKMGTALVIRLFFLVVLCGGFYLVDSSLFFIYAIMPFLLIPIVMRMILLPGTLYTGAKMLKKQRWEDAIPYLEQSAAYFAQREWIDRYRFYLLLSISSRSYVEICFCNHAYCLLQLGRVKESREMYMSVLNEYPENLIAKTQLNNMNLIAQAASQLQP